MPSTHLTNVGPNQTIILYRFYKALCGPEDHCRPPTANSQTGDTGPISDCSVPTFTRTLLKYFPSKHFQHHMLLQGLLILIFPIPEKKMNRLYLNSFPEVSMTNVTIELLYTLHWTE